MVDPQTDNLAQKRSEFKEEVRLWIANSLKAGDSISPRNLQGFITRFLLCDHALSERDRADIARDAFIDSSLEIVQFSSLIFGRENAWKK